MMNKTLYSAQDVKALIAQNAVALVDVRSKEFYDEGHIPGAINIPEMFTYLSTSSPAGLADMQQTFQALFSQAGLSPDKLVISYEDCLDRYYGSSCRGYWLLNYHGHTSSGILEGGYGSWLLAGLPVEKETVTPTATTYVAKPNPTIIATKEDVLAAIDDPHTKLLDDRDVAEWLGESSSPYGIDYAPRKGRIPTAQWIEWYDFMDRTSAIARFKSAEEIQQLCADHGFYPHDNIIIYCFKGARGSNTFVALKEAGFSNVRIYFASWNEWSRDEQLPILAEKLSEPYAAAA